LPNTNGKFTLMIRKFIRCSKGAKIKQTINEVCDWTDQFEDKHKSVFVQKEFRDQNWPAGKAILFGIHAGNLIA
jgi:hypothetical protein